MGAYETLTLILGIAYSGMFPMMLFQEGMIWKWILRATDYTWTEDVRVCMEALFLMLGVVVGGGYLMAYQCKTIEFIDFTVMQRLLIVTPCILLTAIMKQDPINPYLIIYVFLIDGVGAVGHGLTAPGGLKGVYDRFSKFLTNTPKTATQKSLMIESYIGLATLVPVVMYGALMPSPNLAIMTLMVSKLQYLWFLFASLEQDGSHYYQMVPYARIFVVAAEVYLSEVYEFCQLPLRLDAVSTFLGTAQPMLSTLGSCLSTLYMYYIMAAHSLTLENGPMNWLILWGILVFLSSEAWVFLYYDGYDDAQKKRLMNTNWQDRILGIFMVATGGVLDNAGALETGTVGEAVIYLLPIVTLWFTLETKLLNHLQVGTPFHPTWWMGGALPKYAPNDWINITFSLGTTLITAVLTSYAFWAVTKVVGFDSFDFDEASINKFAGVHGIAFVFHSGIWMIIASSGVPNLAKSGIFSVVPPKIVAPLQANPFNCVPAHKADLVAGCFLLFMSAFGLKDNLGEGQELTFKYLTFTCWALTIANKVRIHIQDWGYKAPFPNGKVAAKQD